MRKRRGKVRRRGKGCDRAEIPGSHGLLDRRISLDTCRSLGLKRTPRQTRQDLERLPRQTAAFPGERGWKKGGPSRRRGGAELAPRSGGFRQGAIPGVYTANVASDSPRLVAAKSVPDSPRPVAPRRRASPRYRRHLGESPRELCLFFPRASASKTLETNRRAPFSHRRSRSSRGNVETAEPFEANRFRDTAGL